MHFEKAAVLFNLASVLTQQALNADRLSDAGRKEAARKFQVCLRYGWAVPGHRMLRGKWCMMHARFCEVKGFWYRSTREGGAFSSSDIPNL